MVICEMLGHLRSLFRGLSGFRGCSSKFKDARSTGLYLDQPVFDWT